jgi:hypothetical protein
MAIDTTMLQQIELDLEAAHTQFAQGLLAPNVSEDTKLLAAAITLAGSEIALALAGRNGGEAAREP